MLLKYELKLPDKTWAGSALKAVKRQYSLIASMGSWLRASYEDLLALPEPPSRTESYGTATTFTDAGSDAGFMTTSDLEAGDVGDLRTVEEERSGVDGAAGHASLQYNSEVTGLDGIGVLIPSADQSEGSVSGDKEDLANHFQWKSKHSKLNLHIDVNTKNPKARDKQDTTDSGETEEEDEKRGKGKTKGGRNRSVVFANVNEEHDEEPKQDVENEDPGTPATPGEEEARTWKNFIMEKSKSGVRIAKEKWELVERKSGLLIGLVISMVIIFILLVVIILISIPVFAGIGGGMLFFAILTGPCCPVLTFLCCLPFLCLGVTRGKQVYLKIKEKIKEANEGAQEYAV